MEYIVLRVQVNFSDSLLRGIWLWVGDNLCLLWDYLCLLYPQQTSCLCCGTNIKIFYFCQKYHLKDTHKIFKKILVGLNWMGFVGKILIKLGTSSIWGFLLLFDVLLGVTYANMLVATQWPLKSAPHLICWGLYGMEVWKLIGGMCAMIEEVPYYIVFQCHLSYFMFTQDKKLPILTWIDCLRTVTQVWIHQWLWNDAQNLT